MHDGEVPLDGDGHGDEDGSYAADVAEAEGHRQNVHVQGARVGGRDGGEPEDGDADRQVQDVEQGEAWKVVVRKKCVPPCHVRFTLSTVSSLLLPLDLPCQPMFWLDRGARYKKIV